MSRVTLPPPCRPRPPREIRDVNTRYHDVAAAELRRQVGHRLRRDRPRQVLGQAARRRSAARAGRFARALEIGAGTGYFTLNLMRAGVIGAARCAPTSPPGCSPRCSANARPARAGASRPWSPTPSSSPFETESFDLVLGHAVLHHIPDLERAFAELPPRAAPRRRAGLRRASPRATGTGSPPCPSAARWPLAPRLAAADAAPAPAADREACGGDHGMEGFVDVHAFTPADLERSPATAGFEDVPRARARSCWPPGSAGSTARWRPARARRTCRGCGASTPTAATSPCSRSTAALLEGRLPAGWFYNLLLSARAGR